MIYLTPPKNFLPRSEIVSCFCQVDGKILLLRRVKEDDQQAGKWGAPGGKKESKERLSEAMAREFREETGKKILPKSLTYINKVYVRYPEFDFVYHMFKMDFPREFVPVLEKKEHEQYCWVTPKEALTLDLILDMDECIKLQYGQNK